jgi:hypothetical protein
MEQKIAPPPPDSNEPANPGMPNFADLEALAESQNKALSSQGLEGQGEETETPQPDGQPPEQDKDTSEPIDSLVGELGFKSPEELKKSFKEQHATITRLSQERANMTKEMEAIRQMVMAQMQQRTPMPQGQGEELNAQLYKEIAPFVQQEVAQAVKYTSTLNKVMAKRAENPEEFDDLHPYMVEIVKANPHLEMMPDGLSQAYERAKEFRNSYVRKNLASVLGVDVDKLKTLLESQGTPAPQQDQGNLSEAMAATAVPGSSAPQQRGSEQKIDFASEIKKASEAGDIDKVTALSIARAQRQNAKK